MLKATDVWFAYIAAKPVLRGVSIAVPAAGVVGILGPNGSGKTTLLRLLAGTRRPQRGSVSLDGAPLADLARAALARRMAVVPQETQLAFDYTVAEVAMMGRYAHLGPFEIEGPPDLAVVRDALDSTGTLHLEDRPFATLSGGEKQRVIIAAALAQIFRATPAEIFRLKPEATRDKSREDTSRGFRLQPEETRDTSREDTSRGFRLQPEETRDTSPGFELQPEERRDPSRGFRLQPEETSGGYLLLDEPTASLDLAYQLEVAALLERLHRDRGIAIVISTHDLALAGALCERVLLIRDGEVVAEGPTEEALNQENIRAVYGVEVDVLRHPSGRRVLVPLGRGEPRRP